MTIRMTKWEAERMAKLVEIAAATLPLYTAWANDFANRVRIAVSKEREKYGASK